MRARTGATIICCGLTCYNGMGAISCQEAAWALRATLRDAGVTSGYHTNYLILAVTGNQLTNVPDQKKWLETAGFELLKKFPSVHNGAYPIYLYGCSPLPPGEVDIVPLPAPEKCQQAHYQGQVCLRRHAD